MSNRSASTVDTRFFFGFFFGGRNVSAVLGWSRRPKRTYSRTRARGMMSIRLNDIRADG